MKNAAIKDVCPECGGDFSQWEESEIDCWSHRSGHYTKGSGTDYRQCAECGHEESREHGCDRDDEPARDDD